MRRPLALLALLAALVLALAACGDDGSGLVDDPDQPVTDLPGDGGDGGNGGPVDPGDAGPMAPTPGLLNPIPTAIDGVSVVPGGDGSKLEVRYFNGVRDCYGLDRVEVQEGDESVTIGVFTGGLPPGDQVCIDIAELQTTVVALGAPLGDRQVIDASTGAAVPVG